MSVADILFSLFEWSLCQSYSFVVHRVSPFFIFVGCFLGLRFHVLRTIPYADSEKLFFTEDFYNIITLYHILELWKIMKYNK